MKLALTKIKKELIGVEEFAKQIETLFQDFTIELSDRKRGVLFWGPPGTGKTEAIKKLCEYLDIQMVSDGIMAAGDFNQNIVGDTERMINHLADRARQVCNLSHLYQIYHLTDTMALMCSPCR